MILIFAKPGCPYCERVLAVAKELEVEYTLKPSTDEGAVAELMARGGKRQFPYFVDTDANVQMYESEDIMQYLHQHFPKKQ